MDDERLKTGTTTVGVVAKDCIILAADKRATAGNFIAAKEVDKIINVTDNMALTTAGVVSDIQLLVKVIRAEISLKEIRGNRKMTIKEAANLVAGMLYGSIRQFSVFPSIVHFLFAGNDTQGNHLYDLSPDGAMSEIKDFVASGSGSVFAYGVLEAKYKKTLTSEAAIELAVESVRTAMKRDSASGDGINIFQIDKNGAKKVATKKLESKLI